MENHSVPNGLHLAVDKDKFLKHHLETKKNEKERTEDFTEADALPEKTDLLGESDDEERQEGKTVNLSGGSSEVSLPLPPDGGWGWVVCFSSFLCMVMLDGILFSFGVFFIDLLEYFGEGKGKTAWVGSTLMGTHLIVGPLTSTLVNVWGLRKVAIMGAVIASASFAISVLVPNIDLLIFTYGIMGGIGVSMVYLPALLIVGFYFEKRRALANGFACSGSGVGVFAYAPLTRWLQDEFTWRGALLILSGITLHCIICAALFRPLESRKLSQLSRSDVTNLTNDEDNLIGDNQFQHNVSNISKSKSQGDISRAPKLIVTSPNLHCGSMIQVSGQSQFVQNTKQMFQSMIQIPVNPKLQLSTRTVETSSPTVARRIISKDVFQKPLYRKDIFYSGSIWNLPEFKKNPEKLFYSESILRIPDEESISSEPRSCHKCSDFSYTAQTLMGVTLLKSPTFIFCVLMSVLWTTHASVLTFLPDYAHMSGVDKSSAGLLLSVIGIANIIGRVFAGWLADRPGIDVVWINAVALIVGSLVNIAFPFSTNYYLLVAEAALFGFCMATWTSLRPIVLVELLGLERLTNAFGLLAMFQGLAFCIGSPIAGWIFDITQSYKVPFLFAAGAFMTSGLLCIPMRKLANWENLRCDSMNLDIKV